MGVVVVVDMGQLKADLAAMVARCADMTPAMKAVGQLVRTSVVRNFEEEGRPAKWAPLKPSTIKQRGAKGPILRRKGLAGGLAGSINVEAQRDRAVVGTDKPYAAVHQFGARKGQFGTVMAKVGPHSRTLPSGKIVNVRAHTRKTAVPWGDIPARPYLMVQDEDWPGIQEIIGTFLTQGPR